MISQQSLLLLLIGLLFFPFFLHAYCPDPGDLVRDLAIVEEVNKRLNDRYPTTYNHFLQGGYINMPSALMGNEGEISLGFASVPPYRLYNARCQLLYNLEISGNYRVFCGIDDPVLSSHGFGDFSDKGVNFKFAPFRPEDTNYFLPSIAFGYDDGLGTRAFKSKYVVATQVFPKINLEISLGYGADRIKGFFGGIIWMPWRSYDYFYLRTLSLVTEYDATHYKKDPHPKGRTQRSRCNFGMKYRLWDLLDFSLSLVRGNQVAFSASAFYNFGETTGFLPKIENSLPYCSPVNTEPLGVVRTEDVLVQDFLYAFRDQGFELVEAWINEKTLRLQVRNTLYLWEWDVRSRFNSLLAYLTPSCIERVVIVLQTEGFPVQEYHYLMPIVQAYAAKEIGEHELNLVTQRSEVCYPDPRCSTLLFKDRHTCLCYDLLPKTQTFFGSAQGKFKYSLGINVGFNGFLWENVYCQFLLGYTFFSNIHSLNNMDKLNPSQLINVHTDIVDYYKQRSITVDRAYLQKTWNLGSGTYLRVAAGHFDQVYGGAATEILYYPVNSCWAIGIEGAWLRRRKLTGISFTSKIRKLHGFKPTYVKFTGIQYFLDLYYDLKAADLGFKVSAGQFLAKDLGVRLEVCKYFNSGLKISFWYTYTNAHDRINGQVYYDKGIAFSMPLEIFYTCCSQERFGYGMSAWLRDCGFRTTTGKRLYETIHDARF